MITKNNITSGAVCGFICVAFMAMYAYFYPMNMQSRNISEMKNMHMMPNGEMMMNDTSKKMSVNMNMGDMTMNDMVKMMDGKTGRDLEKEFIAGMIPHHQGAVDMAKKLLMDPTVSVELKNFANQIISAQEREVEMMNEWLKQY